MEAARYSAFVSRTSGEEPALRSHARLERATRGSSRALGTRYKGECEC
jgi:hypothetical protein